MLIHYKSVQNVHSFLFLLFYSGDNSLNNLVKSMVVMMKIFQMAMDLNDFQIKLFTIISTGSDGTIIQFTDIDAEE